MYRSTGRVVGMVCVIILGFFHAPCTTPSIRIAAPTVGQWVSDRAGVLSQDEERAIASRCEDAYTESGVPIVVVVINTMSLYARDGTTIETLARSTFEAWGRDTAFHYRNSWRQGMLLLVSMKDRKARIELGADWAGTADASCEQIMQDYIVLNFRQGNYPEGIASGVDGLVHLAKGESYALSWRRIWLGIWYGIIMTPQFFMITVVAIGFLLFPSWFAGGTARSGSGSNSWDSYDSGGGGGGGSSFGGGGGATGSW